MTTPEGRFVWYELLTKDTAAPERFHGAVLGWDFVDFGNPERPYTIVRAGEHPTGGIMAMPPDMRLDGCRPG